jgi:hypothetical protein
MLYMLVTMVIHIRSKFLFLIFHLFFYTYVAVCLFRCCICLTHILRVFYLDVVYVFTMVSIVFQMFLQVF